MKPAFEPVRAALLEENENAQIYEGFPFNAYELKNLIFSVEEEKFAVALGRALNRGLHSDEWIQKIPYKLPNGFPTAFKTRVLAFADSAEVVERLPSEDDLKNLHDLLKKLLQDFNAPIAKMDAFINRVLDDGVGYGPLGGFMRDPSLEEIMVNGNQRSVFVFHQKIWNV